MSEQEKYKATLKEIEEIYLFLSEQEPTPDDEIEARDKLINKFKVVLDFDAFPEKKSLVEDTLDKLENWDTLELWFKEVDGLSEDIEQVIGSTADSAEEVKEVPSSSEESPSSPAPQVDISLIVTQVADQFKGEITDLKDQIATLQKELEKKEAAKKMPAPKKTAVKKTAPKASPAAKKRPAAKGKSLLPPPEIKIPVIKKPQPKPKITAPKAQPEVKSEPKTKITPVVAEKPKIEPVAVEKPKIQPVTAEKPKIEPVAVEKPKIQPVTAGKPKISPVAVEKPAIQPVTAEKPKIQPVTAEKPAIQPVTAEKPKISPVAIEEPSIQPVSAKKPKVSPFTAEMPNIAPVSIGVVGPSPVRSKGSELFNVFSSVGEKQPGSPISSVEPLDSSLAQKPTRKRGEKKRKRGEKPGITATGSTSFSAFGAPTADLADDNGFGSTADAIPADKDSLYQELIALEGRRYSLEKNYKELETTYQKGTIDDFEYKSKSDELKYRLNEITERINSIRRVIASV